MAASLAGGSVRGRCVRNRHATLDNLRLGTLARATLLGLIDELYELYRSYASRATGHRLLVASANGVQKNLLLPGLLGERFGLPVQLPRWSQPAAVGAAMDGCR